MTKGARGNLKLTKEAIVSVLGLVENDEPEERGRGLLGRDPATGRQNEEERSRRERTDRERKGHPDRKWDETKDKICRWCKILNLAGRHWNNDCRDKAKAKAALKEAETTGEHGVGKMFRDDTSDECDEAIFVLDYRSKTNIAVKIVIQQHKIDVQMVRFTSLKSSAMVRFTWR